MTQLLTDEDIRELASLSQRECFAGDERYSYFARAIETAVITKLREQAPVCYIPDEVIPMFTPPRIRVLGVPLITYHGENHTPLYTAPMPPPDVIRDAKRYRCKGCGTEMPTEHAYGCLFAKLKGSK